VTVRLAVFASGGGTNLQALLDAFQDPARAGVEVALLLSDRPGAGALQRARDAGVDADVVEPTGREPGDVASALLGKLDRAAADMIALAGYLRLVPAEVVRRYRGRMLNIHPALLPAFGGKGLYGERVHRAVLEAGCRVSGATVHFVDERYDTGPILAQWPVPVLPGDTPASLAARVLHVEHRLYPAAVELVARALHEGRDPAGLAGSLTAASSDAQAFELVHDLAPGADGIRRALGLP
jgi:phosphoribosylglycinamide formyltransferase 1